MKERIILEAIESLRREGLKFSVDTLSEKLNISKKTVYKYFPDKEALAREIYNRYYIDIINEANIMAKENTYECHKKLLYLYFDAKSMTRPEIFNKYMLNEVIRSYISSENDILWDILVSAFPKVLSKSDELSLYVIVNGTFEKMLSENIQSKEVIERLVKILW